jgi:hypothetical protein
VPKKPVWYRNLPSIIEELREHPHPYVDRSTLETVLGVGRRRAQQILAPLSERVGAASVADREAGIRRLEQIAASEEGFYEMQRRRKVARVVEGLRRDRLERPQLVVEAPTTVVNQEFENLPAGVRVEPANYGGI